MSEVPLYTLDGVVDAMFCLVGVCGGGFLQPNRPRGQKNANDSDSATHDF